jgi:hypothetical protein
MDTQTDRREMRRLAAAAVAAAVGLAGIGPSPVDAELIVDFRAASINGNAGAVSDPKSVQAVQGDVVAIDVFARVQGTNAENDEAFDLVSGSIYSNNGGLPGDLGNSATVAPFNDAGSQNGSQQDFDSDGDLDIGTIPNGLRPATNNRYFLPNAPVPIQDGVPVAGANPAAEDWLVGTLTFTVVGSAGSTDINFVRRLLPQGTNDPAASTWFEDGSLRTGTNPYSSNPLTITAVPEPTAAALAGLASLGLLARRRNKTA